jgi:hypothetical protein
MATIAMRKSWSTRRRSTRAATMAAVIGSASLLASSAAGGELRPGMARHRGGGLQAAAGPICSTPSASYFGGPILQHPKIVAVFWNADVNATLQSSIGQFYTDVMASSYWPWLQEYDTVGLAGGTEQATLPGTFVGSFVLKPLTCPAGSGACQLGDPDIQAELARQIGLGKLPAPTLDCTGNADTLYIVDVPPAVTIVSGSVTSCVDFCGYHGTTLFGPNAIPLLYGVIMDTFTGPCATGCGSFTGNALQNTTVVTSHELIEAVTDPDIGLNQGLGPPVGWYDGADIPCGEVGDICENGAGDTISVNGRTWMVQEIWSNRQQGCVSGGPADPVCAGANLAACRKCSCGDNGNACGGATATCETTTSNVLFGACEACTSTSGSCGSRACLQSTNPRQDDVCAGTIVPAPALGDKTPLLASLLLLAGSLATSRRRRAA